MPEDARSALVFGARNLGRAVLETLSGAGWSVAGVARSDATEWENIVPYPRPSDR